MCGYEVLPTDYSQDLFEKFMGTDINLVDRDDDAV